MKLTIKHQLLHAFTRLEFVAICAAVFLCTLIVLPSIGRTHNNNSLTQSMNNMRQLMNAWSMYPAQNGGRLVYSYPNYNGNTNTWCRGNAQSGGAAGSFVYGGADPTGIQTGDLWPYVRNLASYKCPTDNRLATSAPLPYKNQLILRSYSINSYMAGTTFGASSEALITLPTSWDTSNYGFFVRESQLSRPSKLFVFVEEDGASISDGMILVNISTSRLYDLPTRHHSNQYPLTFADGHFETYRFKTVESMNWVPGQNGGLPDWQALTNITTFLR